MEELFDGYVCTSSYGCLLPDCVERPCSDCPYCVSVEYIEEVTK